MEEFLVRQFLSELMMSAAYDQVMGYSGSSDDDDSVPDLLGSDDESTEEDSPRLRGDRSFTWKGWCVDEAPVASNLCSALEKIKISELRIGERYIGKVLYGTLRDTMVKDTSLQALLEDDAGNVVKLVVYHIGNVELRKGMRLAIKEPYLKVCLDGSTVLRVDSPGDVVVDSFNTREEETAEGKTTSELLQVLSTESVSCAAACKWDKAIQAYSTYISLLESSVPKSGDGQSGEAPREPSLLDTGGKTKGKGTRKKGKSRVQDSVPGTRALVYERKVAYSGRAQAWLEVGHYQNALADAVKALELDPYHEQTALRKGKALLGMERYQEAVGCLQELVQRGGKGSDYVRIGELLTEAKTAERQNRLGLYSLDDYFLKGRRGDPPKCSEFLGPLEIKASEGHPHAGRGLFLTKGVKEGELLLVGNPIAVSDLTPQAVGAGIEASFAVTEDLVTQLIASAIRCPQRRKQLDSLQDSGDGTPKPVPPMAIFTPSVSPETVENLAEGALDVSRVRRIVEINAFKGEDLHGHTWSSKQQRRGVWALPSFINHSCAPNSIWTRVGDTMFVRAFRNLSAGEEVTISYIDVYLPVQERSRLLSARRIQCCCARCGFEQDLVNKLPVFNRLAKQLVEFKAMNPADFSRPSSLRKAAEGAEKVEKIVSELQASDGQKKNWIRASYTRFYVWKSYQLQERSYWLLALHVVLEIMSAIYPSEQALGYLGLALHLPELPKTWSSRWKELARKICKVLHGPLQEKTINSLLEQENAKFQNGLYR